MFEINYMTLRICLLSKDIEINGLKDVMGCLQIHKKSYKKQEFILTEGDALSHTGLIYSGFCFGHPGL